MCSFQSEHRSALARSRVKWDDAGTESKASYSHVSDVIRVLGMFAQAPSQFRLHQQLDMINTVGLQ